MRRIEEQHTFSEQNFEAIKLSFLAPVEPLLKDGTLPKSVHIRQRARTYRKAPNSISSILRKNEVHTSQDPITVPTKQQDIRRHLRKRAVRLENDYKVIVLSIPTRLKPHFRERLVSQVAHTREVAWTENRKPVLKMLWGIRKVRVSSGQELSITRYIQRVRARKAANERYKLRRRTRYQQSLEEREEHLLSPTRRETQRQTLADRVLSWLGG